MCIGMITHLNANPPTIHFMSDGRRRSATKKTIQNQIALVRK